MSRRAGADGCAPARVTEHAAAALANRADSRSDLPSAIATTSAPLKTSPAPVVSIALTRNPRTSCRTPLPATNAPRDPIVITTFRTPRRQQRLGRSRRRPFAVDDGAGEPLGLALVRRQEIYVLEERARQRTGRRRIQHQPQAGDRRQMHRGFDRSDRNFELQQRDARGAKGLVRPAHVSRADRIVRTRCDRDAVLPAPGDVDECDPGWNHRIARHMPHVDARPGKTIDRSITLVVSADPGHERDRTASARGGNRLVRTLAPRRPGKRTSEYRLARPRKTRSADDQIGIRTADDENLWLGLSRGTGHGSRILHRTSDLHRARYTIPTSKVIRVPVDCGLASSRVTTLTVWRTHGQSVAVPQVIVKRARRDVCVDRACGIPVQEHVGTAAVLGHSADERDRRSLERERRDIALGRRCLSLRHADAVPCRARGPSPLNAQALFEASRRAAGTPMSHCSSAAGTAA